ncbi:MAG: hypothetical protein ACRC46_10775 [Thermoguttaceae bacterium]
MLERNSKIVCGLSAVGTCFLLTGATFGQMAASPAGAASAPVVQQVSAVVPAVSPSAPSASAFDVDRALTDARKAIAARDLSLAERILKSVDDYTAKTSFKFRDQDDQPRHIAPLLEQSKKLAAEVQTNGATESFRRQYAQLALVQADGFLRKGELELARQLTQEAAAQNILFNEAARKSGLEPQVMFQRIEAARIARQTASTAVYRSNADATQTLQVRDYESRSPQLAPQLAPAIPSEQSPLVDRARQAQQAAVQQVATEIMQHISDAQRITQERGDTDESLRILRRAKERLAAANLDPATQASFNRNIDTAIQNIEASAQHYSARTELQQANEQVLRERRAEQEENLAIQQKLKTYVEECNKCIEEERWNDAVVIAKKARDLAPDDPVTHQLILVAQLTSRTRRYEQIKEQKEEGFVEAMLNVDKTSIPWSDNVPMQFPDTWDALKKRRGTEEITNNRPESEREILRRLEMPVSLNLDRPTPFGQVLQMLRAQSGVPIFPQETDLRAMDVTSDTLIRFPVNKEVTLRSALNLILEPLGLAFVVENEVLNITTAARKNRGRMYPKAYYVGDIIHSVPNSDGSHPHSLESAHQRGVRLANETIEAMRRQGSEVQSPAPAGQPIASNNTTTPDTVLAQNSAGYTSFGAPDGQLGKKNGSQGGANIGEIITLIEEIVYAGVEELDEVYNPYPYQNNGSLLIRTTEDYHTQIADLLSQMRKLSDLQITIEVRYVTLDDSYAEKMGVDFDVNIPNGVARGRFKSQGVINAPAPSTSDYFGGKTVVGMSAADGQISSNFDIPINQGSYALAQPTFGSAQGLTSAGASLGFAILSDIETYFFLSAAQNNIRSNVMQAPKVTIFNGQYGSVNDTTTRPFVTSVSPVVNDFAAAYQPVITMINSGQILNVQGSVTSDRRFVKLTLNPIVTVLEKVETYKYVGSDEITEGTESSKKGDNNAAASTDEKKESVTRARVSQGITVQQPVVSQFSVNTTVSVPDGGTIVLGGIKRLSEGRSEYGTPMLSKIPYLNRLFMNTAVGRDTSSVMMVVTPRIIIQEEEEAQLGYTPSR